MDRKRVGLIVITAAGIVAGIAALLSTGTVMNPSRPSSVSPETANVPPAPAPGLPLPGFERVESVAALLAEEPATILPPASLPGRPAAVRRGIPGQARGAWTGPRTAPGAALFDRDAAKEWADTIPPELQEEI